MNRADVYKLLDGERAYQESLWPAPHSVGDYLTMLRYYGRLADAAWTVNSGDQPALNVIRKITAIGVHCMEEHGAPQREWWHRDMPTVEQSMAVADPRKVYILTYNGIFIDVYRNKIDAHKEANHLSIQDNHPVTNYEVRAREPIADSGERL
jgi:hypothetical protein